jgi:16S rRNA (guanine527-N7)-methyltransferase
VIDVADVTDVTDVTDELAASDIPAQVLGAAYEKLKMFHVKLFSEGEVRGLIGPRELAKLWERHILNSAALAPFISDFLRKRGLQSLDTSRPSAGSSGNKSFSAGLSVSEDFSVSLGSPLSADSSVSVNSCAASESSASLDFCGAPSDYSVPANASQVTIADVGSGAGFPGIVLACLFPQINFVLIEPMERRVTWLHEVVDELGLSNVVIIRRRAEELQAQPHIDSAAAENSASSAYTSRSVRPSRSSRSSHKSHSSKQFPNGRNPQSLALAAVLDDNVSRETFDTDVPQQFDIVTCRAVAPMTKLAGWTLPLLRRGGQLIALKGQSAQAEIEKARKEIAKCGGLNPRVEEAVVGPGLESTHVVLVDKK